ncbi:MAG: DUF664 domain-containing protein [Dehalococcoidia bacterium]|nr:DUF664 domain-containing protein [Dehalococcoidia bacterium]
MARDYTPPLGLHSLLAALLLTGHERHVDMSDLVSGLPEGALDWRPSEGVNSLAGLVRHILHVEGAMVAAAGGDTTLWDPTQGARLEESGSEQDLLDAIEACDAAMKTVLPGLTPDDLARSHPGESRSVGSGLVEEFDHSAMHYGHMQVTRLLWEQAHPEVPRTYEHWGWHA